jgi:DNA invertase Pin-like site-specific DNA recombinase
LRTIQDLEAVGVDLYLDQQHIDTTTPTGKLLFHVTVAFSERECSMLGQRVSATGIRRILVTKVFRAEPERSGLES